MKPTPAMYCLHIRQEQFVGLHLLIEDLKASKEVISFSSVGNEFHVFGPRTEMLSLPLRTVFTFGMSNRLLLRKL